MNFVVEKEIFNCFPGMKIIAVECRGAGAGDAEKISILLNEGWKTAGEAALLNGNAQSHPFIKP